MTTSQNSNKDQEISPQFSIQRIYTKDVSFEVPSAPEIYRKGWSPKINLDLNTTSKKLDDDFYEVVLTVTTEVKTNDEIAFVAEIHQGGIFLIKGIEESKMGHTLNAFCPNILFPYAREALDTIVMKGSFPALMLSPVNFDALYAQEIAKNKQNVGAEAPVSA